MTNEQAKALLLQVVNALFDTIREAGDMGCPSGSLYMACNARGMSLDTYQKIMSALVAAGKVRLSNHCYFAVKQ